LSITQRSGNAQDRPECGIAILAERLVQALAAQPGVPRDPRHATRTRNGPKCGDDLARIAVGENGVQVGQSRLVVVEVRGGIERHGPDRLAGTHLLHLSVSSLSISARGRAMSARWEFLSPPASKRTTRPS